MSVVFLFNVGFVEDIRIYLHTQNSDDLKRKKQAMMSHTALVYLPFRKSEKPEWSFAFVWN